MSSACCPLLLITSDTGGGNCVCLHSSVCLSVCLSVSKITEKHVHGFGWNVTCRQMSGQLLSPIRILVRMPEPDYFLRYRMHCNADFYYVGKIPHTGIGHPSLQWHVVIKWFYSCEPWEQLCTCAPPSALLVCSVTITAPLLVCDTSMWH